MVDNGEIRLFVSHHSSKKEVAEHVERELANRGVSCWMAPRDVEPGEPFDRAVRNAIESSTAILLLFCGNSEKSRHVKRELILADTGGLPIIPLRLEAIDPGDLSYFLADSQWIDWIEKRGAVIDRVAAQARHYAGLAPAAGASVPKEATPPPVESAPPPVESAPPPPPPVESPPPPAPPAASAAPPLEPASVESGRSRIGLWIGLAVAALLLIVGVLVFLPSADRQGTAAADTEATGEEEPADAGSAVADSDVGVPAPAAQAAQAAPTTTYPTSFNCAAASTYVERTICGDADLASRETQMAQLYRNLRQNFAATNRNVDDLVGDQRGWLAYLDECTDRSCIVTVIDQRIDDLDAMFE